MAEHALGESAAGWKKDPFGRYFGRYWNGDQWTEHVISAETVPSIDPAGRRNPEPARIPAQGTGTGTAGQQRLGSWKSDPSGRHAHRYWDGWDWTEHVMSAERVPGLDPLPQRNAGTQPGRAVVTATAPIKVVPAAATAESPGSSRPLPLRAWDGFRGWPPAVRSALGIISVIVGLIAIGSAISGGGSRPVLRKGPTTIAEAVTTTSAAPPVESTVPVSRQAPTTLAATPADSGAAPATTVGTAPGGPPAVDPTTTLPEFGKPTTVSSMLTTS